MFSNLNVSLKLTLACSPLFLVKRLSDVFIVTMAELTLIIDSFAIFSSLKILRVYVYGMLQVI